MANRQGLWDYRLEVNADGLRSLGAMEDNVDKLFADGIKKRGMSWAKKGANRIAKLISLGWMGKLEVGERGWAKPVPASLNIKVQAYLKRNFVNRMAMTGFR